MYTYIYRLYTHIYIYIYIYIIGGSRLQWKLKMYTYRDQKKRKEEGTRKGAREQSLAPKELSPPPPHRRLPATPQRITAACSSTHDGPRARAQGPTFRIHTASTKGGAGAMAGRPTDKTYRQTETATKRETQRRKEG